MWQKNDFENKTMAAATRILITLMVFNQACFKNKNEPQRDDHANEPKPLEENLSDASRFIHQTATKEKTSVQQLFDEKLEPKNQNACISFLKRIKNEPYLYHIQAMLKQKDLSSGRYLSAHAKQFGVGLSRSQGLRCAKVLSTIERFAELDWLREHDGPAQQKWLRQKNKIYTAQHRLFPMRNCDLFIASFPNEKKFQSFKARMQKQTPEGHQAQLEVFIKMEKLSTAGSVYFKEQMTAKDCLNVALSFNDFKAVENFKQASPNLKHNDLMKLNSNKKPMLAH